MTRIRKEEEVSTMESMDRASDGRECKKQLNPLDEHQVTSDQFYHPLDPLSSIEIDVACTIAKEHAIQKLQLKDIKVTYINLIEPSKEDVLGYLGILNEERQNTINRRSIKRECEVCAIDVNSTRVYLIEIDLYENKLNKPVELLPIGTHPTISPEEVDEAERITKNDIQIQRLCEQVGISRDQIFCDGWALGFDSRFGNHKRLQQCLMYARLVPDGNLYAHPLDFVVIVDTFAKKVIHVDFPPHYNKGENKLLSSNSTQPTLIDGLSNQENNHYLNEFDLNQSLLRSGRDRIKPPINRFEFLPELLNDGKSNDNHDQKLWKIRQDLKPLEIIQPIGVSFTLKGNVLEWQKWKMHIGFNYREGLIINTITYNDQGSIRPIFYRLSLAEMVVPYGAPESPHHRKFAFDVGEYGIGNLANSLQLGCDCVGSIQYLDVVNVSLDGKPLLVKNAICIHEEDAGLLWKHSDLRPGGRTHSVRSRKLVISMICTIANYDYLFYWNFFQDGSIDFDVKLTGILNAYLMAEDESKPRFGTEVAPRVIAQHHTHTFCLRIDPMIDGMKNSVVQSDLVPLEAPTWSEQNYLGNGFEVHKKILKRTSDGAQDYDHCKGRYWSIINPNKTHYSSKDPIAYKIVCKEIPKRLVKPDSMVARRAPFTRHDLFVTPYVPQQYYPSGKFVPGTMDSPSDSIAEWLKVDKSIDNEDIVVYLTFGVHHVAAPEQFPVMPAETISVSLKPVGFFDQNPSLDVPDQSKLNTGRLVCLN